MRRYLPYVYILLAGSLWGVIGLFTRTLNANGISPYSIVALRSWGGVLVLTVIALVRDRSVFRVKPKHLPCFFGTGVIGTLFFSLCYFSCQQICSLAVAAILLYTAPAFVVILSAFLWKERITRKKLLALVIAFLGCTFVTGVWSGNLIITSWGLLIGIGSGVFYSLYTVFNRYALDAHYAPFTVTLYTFLFTALGSLVGMRPTEVAIVAERPSLLVVVAGIVLISSVTPCLLYTRGLGEMADSGKASILASIEPVVAAFMGIIAFGEPMSIMVLLGLGCILLSVYILR